MPVQLSTFRRSELLSPSRTLPFLHRVFITCITFLYDLQQYLLSWLCTARVDTPICGSFNVWHVKARSRGWTQLQGMLSFKFANYHRVKVAFLAK